MTNISLYWRHDYAQVNVNGAHITVKTKDKNILFSRDGINPEWYNPSHQRIMTALHNLEKAIESAIIEENWDGA